MRTRNLIAAVALFTVLGVLVALTVVTRADAEQTPGTIIVSSTGPVTERCPGAQKAITHYRQSYAKSRTTMGLPGPVPRVWYYDCTVVKRRAAEWRDRARIETIVLRNWSSTVGQIVRRLDAGLAGTPMAGLGAILERFGRKYGVSPYFMAAAAGTESSFGAAGCSNNPKNVWGLAACDGRWYVPYFTTWEYAIEFYARFLSSRWSNHSTPYSFRGYAACDTCWGRKTSMHMSRFGVSNSTRYE